MADVVATSELALFGDKDCLSVAMLIIILSLLLGTIHTFCCRNITEFHYQVLPRLHWGCEILVLTPKNSKVLNLPGLESCRRGLVAAHDLPWGSRFSSQSLGFFL